VTGWGADYPDPDNFLRVIPWKHLTGWQNETYERLIEEARGLADQRQRLQLYQQAERIMLEEAAVVPLYYDSWQHLLKPWVRRYPISGMKDSFWKDVILEPH
jgi:oligopeptide transport system substrate-binding protein